jgi:hypothetical protein
MRFEEKYGISGFMRVEVQIVTIWAVTLCSHVGGYQHFGKSWLPLT